MFCLSSEEWLIVMVSEKDQQGKEYKSIVLTAGICLYTGF